MCRDGGLAFSKVLSIATFSSKCTRALTYENFWQEERRLAWQQRQHAGPTVTTDPQTVPSDHGPADSEASAAKAQSREKSS